MLVLVCLVISDLYLFHFIILLNHDFNCSKILLSSSVDKVTTGTYNFASFISNIAFAGLLKAAFAGSTSGSASFHALLVITQFSDQVNIRVISRLINGISSALQKLLKFFNILLSNNLTSSSAFLPSNLPVILVL